MIREVRFFLPILLLAGCVWGTVARADDEAGRWTDRLELSGWADAIQSMRTRSPYDGLTSRVRLRLELSADLDQLYAFVSADAEKNWEISSGTGVDLHEAWVEHADDSWDVRIGRQIIIWGRADGVQITDMISPPDYTESITRDLDEIRMPVDAAKFRLLGDQIDAELIWIPFFKAAVQPTGDNPWAVRADFPENVRVSSTPAVEPGSSLGDSEIALKISAFLSGLDLAASVFYTWDDNPAAHRSVHTKGDVTAIEFTPEHHRLTVFGLEGARPWSDFVFRCEAACYKGRYYAPASIPEQPLKKDAIKWLGGVDWTPGDDWSVTAQLTGNIILNHDARLANDRHELTATLNISKKLLRQTLTLSNMVYWDMDENEMFDRVKAEYEVSDGFFLSVGADIFSGGDGKFGAYEKNSQVWGKARYSF